MDSGFVQRCLGSGERHTVVGGDDHKRALEFLGPLERRQNPSQVGVIVGDFKGVVGQVGAHDVGIGQEGRHAHLLQARAVAGCDTGLEGAVGFAESDPETKRGARRDLLQESLEVTGVVQVA